MVYTHFWLTLYSKARLTDSLADSLTYTNVEALPGVVPHEIIHSNYSARAQYFRNINKNGSDLKMVAVKDVLNLYFVL